MLKGPVIFLCEVVVSVSILTLIGAVILKVSCVLYDMLAGASATPSEPLSLPASESKPETASRIPPVVPRPSVEWAMCIVFVAALISMLAGFVAIRVLRLAGQAAGLGALRTMPSHFVFYPLGILALSVLNAAMLPTSFRKGVLVTLLFLFLSILIAAVVAAVLFSFGLALGLAFPRLDW